MSYDAAVTEPKDDASVPEARVVSGDAGADAGGEPPARPSHVSLENIPVHFPDDGPLSTNLRRVDHYLGLIEQAILVALLAAVVLVASGSALSDKLAHHQFGRWWYTIVRAGTFSIAMFGAVFATHQQRHLAMDLVSRRLPPRGRLVLGVLLKLLTIAIAVLFFRSGIHQRDTVGSAGEELSLLGLHITDKDIVTTIPIGAALIMVHCALHAAIEIEYLVRGKLLPERARSGH